MAINLIILILFTLSTVALGQSAPHSSDSCAQKAQMAFQDTLNTLKSKNLLNGRSLCLVVEAQHRAIEHCQQKASSPEAKVTPNKDFIFFLKRLELVTSEDAEAEIVRLKSRWMSSSFPQQRAISKRILALRTCHSPAQDGTTSVIYSASEEAAAK